MIDDTERLVVTLEARIRDFERNMQKASRTSGDQFTRIERRAKQAGDRMEKTMAASSSRVGSILKNFGIGLAGGIAGGLTVAGLNQIVGQVGKVAEGVANIGSAAKRAGVDVRSFQELSFVADQNRIAVDALTDGLKELNLRADEFIVTGKGSGAEAFNRLGLSASLLRTKLKQPADLLVEIIGRMQQLDRAAQIRVADELFGGTAGERFVELVDQGADGIRRQIEEAHRLGLVLDEGVIRRADEIDRKFKAIASAVSTEMKGAVVELAGAMLDWWDSLKSIEEQQTRTLGNQLADIGQRRLDIENQILQLRAEQADAIPGNPFGVDHAQTIADLEAESAELAETEGRILRVLEGRYQETAATARETVPAVQNLNNAVTGTGSATNSAVAGIDSYAQAIRALKNEIPELANQLATLDARTKIDAVYQQALLKARTVGETIQASELRDRALSSLATKDVREAASGGMLDLIGYAEGTDKGRGYNETLGYGKFTGGPRNLTLMTLDQIDAMQTQMLRHPENSFNSSAAGRYQIVQKTLRGLRDQLGLSGDEFFDAGMQDRLAQELLRRRGNDVAGLRNEWEGLRRVDDATIRRAYDGTSVSMPAIDPGRAANAEQLRDQASAYAEIVAGAKSFTAEMQFEAQALDMTAMRAAALRYEQQMLNDAQARGISVTPQQRAEIQQLANGMAAAEQAAVSYAESQQQAAEMSAFFGNQAVDALTGILTGTMTVEDALRSMINALIKATLQAAILGEGPLAGLFGGGSKSAVPGSTGGTGKGIMGLFGSLLGFAEGGFTGPGGKHEPAGIVHRGEYVFDKAATSRIGVANLEAIRSGQLPGYANGGYVGEDAGTNVARMIRAGNDNGGAPSFTVNAPITVNGSAGTPEQNADLARRMRKEMEATMRGVVADEMRKQTRPGNMANTRSR